MLLGGIRYLLPVIKAAHEQGYYVITADYLPDNIAHKYSDEYVNVSIIDKEAVLRVAKEKQIDGIMSFGVDPGVVSAAYVAEQMGLPFQCSYESACILQDKSRFRRFLAENGFNCPKAKGYDDIEAAIKNVDYFNWPVIVKPVDSAGSKGVTKVENKENLRKAIEYAISESHNGHFIIEDFLEKVGYSYGSESFAVEGRLLYNGFYDQYFDKEAINPFTPAAECWPSTMDLSRQKEIKSELQRLFDLLGVRSGIFNVECRVCTDGKAYLMEVSPRGGGNRLAELLQYAADVDLIEAEVNQALGLPIEGIHEPNYKGCFTIQVLHATKSGIFNSIIIDEDFKKRHVVEEEVRVSRGEKVMPFTGANTAIGTLFLKASNRREMDEILERIDEFVNIVLE